MYRVGFVVVAFVAGCGESMQVSTSSTPPPGGATDGGGVGMPPDAGSGGVDGGAAADAGVADGGAGRGSADAGLVDAGLVDAGSLDGGSVDAGGSVDGGGGPTACTLPGPTKLASSHLVTKLLVDGDQLYFLDVASAFAGLYRMPKAGGTPTLIAPVVPLQSDGSDWDFAVDETTIYLTYAVIDDGFGRVPNDVTLIDKASGVKRSVHVNRYGCTHPAFTRVTAVGGTVWLVQHNGVIRFSPVTCTQDPFDTIERLPPGATQSQAIETLAPGTIEVLADSTHLFWSGARGTFRALHDGSAVEMLAPVAAGQLVSDGGTLFAVVGMSVEAITAPQQLATIYEGASLSDPQQPLAVDTARVWIGTPSAVVAVDKDGAAPRTVAPGDGVRAVAVDATQVYYFSGQSVMTACK